MLKRFVMRNFIGKNVYLYNLYWYNLGLGTHKEIMILPKLLKPKHGKFIDIGAHSGGTAAFFLRKCKASQVYAFEPQPKLCQWMTQYLKDYKGVSIYNMGLSDSESKLQLNIPLTPKGSQMGALATFQKLSGAHESITIPVKTLDSFGFTNIDFIKIDVEGFESKVLTGAKETIKNNRPMMLVEINQSHLDREGLTVEAVINQITDMDYKCYYYSKNQLIPVEGSAISEISKHIFDFFFFPEEMEIPCLQNW